jgi:hypothetical protein
LFHHLCTVSFSLSLSLSFTCICLICFFCFVGILFCLWGNCWVVWIGDAW